MPYSCWRRTTSMSSRPEEPRRPNVVATHGLRDGRHHLGPLWARGFVDDRDDADALRRRARRGARPEVECECSDPARSRRVRREDRGSHGSCAPFGRCPACWRFSACSVPGQVILADMALALRTSGRVPRNGARRRLRGSVFPPPAGRGRSGSAQSFSSRTRWPGCGPGGESARWDDAPRCSRPTRARGR